MHNCTINYNYLSCLSKGGLRPRLSLAHKYNPQTGVTFSLNFR